VVDDFNSLPSEDPQVYTLFIDFIPLSFSTWMIWRRRGIGAIRYSLWMRKF
jgi:hypothetical protein